MELSPNDVFCIVQNPRGSFPDFFGVSCKDCIYRKEGGCELGERKRRGWGVEETNGIKS
jgi:hypothetical protein